MTGRRGSARQAAGGKPPSRPRLRTGAAFLLPAWACLAAGLSGCLGLFAGGDATETGNAVAGTAIFEDGRSAAGARVTLVPEGHNPVLDPDLPDSLTDLADGDGGYGIDAPPGRYNLEAVHPATGRRFFVRGVTVAADGPVRRRDILLPPGALSLSRPDWLPREGGWFYVPGSTFKADLERSPRQSGRHVFDSLPSSALGPVRYVQGRGDTASQLLVGEAVVRPGAVEAVHPFAAWSGSARILLNTSATGAAIEKDLTDFPLLVRLSAPIFGFAAARPDGGDLRFAKPDGTPLPFALAAWDPAGSLAWVRLDTVRAGEPGQYITAHWGNGAASRPAMAPVFDTAAGFAGVWHLDGEAADTVANAFYKDATQAGNHGNDRIAATGTAGVVGPGHAFARGDYVQVPSATGAVRAARYTLSAWFRSQLQATNLAELISVGDNYGLRLDDNGRLHTFFWPQQAPPSGQPPWYTVGTQGADFLDGNWHLVQGTYDGSILRLCLDGREMAALAVPGPVDFRFKLNVTLGRHGNGQAGFDFTGDLDEVQIHSRARGVDWNKLSYENQRPGSGFPELAGP